MKKWAFVLFAFLLLGVFAWYFLFKEPQSPDNAQVAAQSQEMPPMPVAMVTIAPQQTAIWKTYPAKVEAINFAEVRPQASGEVTQVKFKAGDTVKKGQVLMVIDTKVLTDQLNVAKADLIVAQSSLDVARENYERGERLIASNAISQRDYEQRKAEYERAKASIDLAGARIKQTETSLNYAYVRAPFSGVISRANVTKGNVVQAGPSAPVLFSILSNDGVYVDFDVDEQTYLQYASSGAKDIQLKVNLPSSDNTITSEFLSFDNISSGGSGTVQARGIVKGDSMLLPGMSVRASISAGESDSVIVVPETAIGIDQNRRFVWTVDENNVVQYRLVELGALVDSGRVIRSGLNEGDVVVADGLIKIRPNTVVMDMSQLPAPSESAPVQAN